MNTNDIKRALIDAGGKRVYLEWEFGDLVERETPYQDGRLRKIFPGCQQDAEVPHKVYDVYKYYHSGNNGEGFRASRGAYGYPRDEEEFFPTPPPPDENTIAIVVEWGSGDTAGCRAESWQSYGGIYVVYISLDILRERFTPRPPYHGGYDDCYFCSMSCALRADDYHRPKMGKKLREFLSDFMQVSPLFD